MESSVDGIGVGEVATASRAGDETGEIIIRRTGRVVKTLYPVPALGSTGGPW